MRFGVRSGKEKSLLERMKRLGICESDLTEKFVRSGGKGGQHLNKTATCVYLKHVPSGIEVKMQKDRSQTVNRFLARRVLAEKIERRFSGTQTAEQKRTARIRKQKRRRCRRSKKKIEMILPENYNPAI